MRTISKFDLEQSDMSFLTEVRINDLGSSTRFMSDGWWVERKSAITVK